MKLAYIISTAGHAAILLWSVWTLAAKPLNVPPGDALPVDLVSVSELTRLTAGSRTEAVTPQPMVETIAEPKPAEEPAAKVEKKEIKAARESAAPPEAKPAESKPAESKPEKTQAKPDQIAEALAKEELKPPEPKKAAKTPTPPRKPSPPTPPAPKFDPRQVEALLDKRQATRLAAAGAVLNPAASAGVARGSAPQMSLSELDALRQRLGQLWNIPAGAKDPEELTVQVRVRLKPDGTLAAPPMVLSSGNSPLFVAARESAIRALYRGQPFNMLRPETYELWKDIEITFDPRSMVRG
jgi:colicin import membrane protein